MHILLGLLSGGVIGGLVANYIAIRKLRPEIKKVEAEVGEIEAKSWMLLIQAQGNRITILEEKLKERESQREEELQRIVDLEEEIDELRDWIKARGLVPPERKRARKV